MVHSDRLPLAFQVRRYLVIAEVMKEMGCRPLLPTFPDFIEEETNWDAALHLPHGALALGRFAYGVFYEMQPSEILRHLALEKALGNLIPYPLEGSLDNPGGLNHARAPKAGCKPLTGLHVTY